MLFDAHCHLAPIPNPPPPLPERPAVAGRLLCGVAPGEFARLRAVAAEWSGTIAAYGVHPWHVAETLAEHPDWLDRLAGFLAGDPAAWVGEAGLDGMKRDIAPMETQDRVFREQLRLAVKTGRKVNLHCVKAWDGLLAALDAEYVARGPRAFIIHSFGGPHQMVAALAERGAYFTVGPLTARRDGRRQRARVALFPLERILVESDAFLPPGVDAGGELLHCLNWLAEARGMEAEVLAGIIDENVKRISGHA